MSIAILTEFIYAKFLSWIQYPIRIILDSQAVLTALYSNLLSVS